MQEEYDFIIVGAGFAGLCLAIKMISENMSDFLILEKATNLGGTWRDNVYPGAECDIPSVLYSYSFEHSADWQYKWSTQSQILKYQHDTAKRYGVDKHIRYQKCVRRSVFNESEARWLVICDDGSEYFTRHLVSAVGQLHIPQMPEIDCPQSYQGEIFHSACWPGDFDFDDKRVAVIGSAASAVQLIPEIAKKVKSLTVFQRSPNWILPKQDRAYTRLEQWLSKKVPVATKFYRFNLWAKGEWGILPAIKGNRLARFLLRTWSLLHLRRSVQCQSLQDILIPDYPIGAKRILFSDNYFSTLTQPHVKLETQSIQSFTKTGLKTVARTYDFDAIICATGFKTNPFLNEITILGKARKRLADHWQKGAFAYLGVATHGFPNLHFMYGPNTNLGHSSIIIMLEAQADYIIRFARVLKQERHRYMEIRKDIELAFNQAVEKRLSAMAFSQVSHSWYQIDGKITNNWPGGTREYTRRLSRVQWHDYQCY